ncbi:hypothetical protein A0H81_03887 [Grifola frondosa]|uniref:Uncharacterized protein n=1 Tax=Grifola frondosa TaxID=5627 RepID=A0A1C7MHX5_GRIFR|nr:hypothetical protein A0H81_03887 [Grifola frondosa]
MSLDPATNPVTNEPTIADDGEDFKRQILASLAKAQNACMQEAGYYPGMLEEFYELKRWNEQLTKDNERLFIDNRTLAKYLAVSNQRLDLLCAPPNQQARAMAELHEHVRVLSVDRDDLLAKHRRALEEINRLRHEIRLRSYPPDSRNQQSLRQQALPSTSIPQPLMMQPNINAYPAQSQIGEVALPYNNGLPTYPGTVLQPQQNTSQMSASAGVKSNVNDMFSTLSISQSGMPTQRTAQPSPVHVQPPSPMASISRHSISAGSRNAHRRLSSITPINTSTPSIIPQRRSSTGAVRSPAPSIPHTPMTPASTSGAPLRSTQLPLHSAGGSHRSTPSSSSVVRTPTSVVIDLTLEDGTASDDLTARKRRRIDGAAQPQADIQETAITAQVSPLPRNGSISYTSTPAPQTPAPEENPIPSSDTEPSTLLDDCIEANFEEDDEDEARRWCRMCRSRFQAGHTKEPPTPFVDASQDILADHCERVHPKGWEILKQKAAQHRSENAK